ncbi:hypothetical protein [Paenibacillus albus]|uniref:YtxH domain-containing protein n=1 Tax=Paenibacillus albus TaxID=2495582 RepID=A0A3Q8X5Q4_9BACL|nr:hypothetical protein [Paenibacillus albus]AZN40693.1 hypothetical protein EJC50_14280 [Paenibacillus albus]
MRLTGFLIGSLAGMAAAAYVARKRPGMFAWASSAAGQAVSGMSRGMTRKAMGAMMSRQFTNEASHAVPKHTGGSAGGGSGKDSWSQIEMLLNSDPSVKQQVDDIKAEAAKPH